MKGSGNFGMRDQGEVSKDCASGGVERMRERISVRGRRGWKK